METKITTQMKKGVIEYAVLAIISKGEAYASDIISTLKHNNLIVVEGTLYPLLSRLKTDEMLNYSRVESPQGPPRKYYSLTDKGQETLITMRKTRTSLTKTISNIDQTL